MRHGMLRLCLVTFLPAMAGAQTAQTGLAGRAALPVDSVPLSTAAAEALGARMPRLVWNNAADSLRDLEAPGTGERQCVDAGGKNVARSGDFVAGPFDNYRGSWQSGFGKLWWAPRHLPTPALPLTVRAVRLDKPAESRVFEGFTISRTFDSSSGTLHNSIYPSGMHLPEAGRWMLLATSGANWGCFLVTVQ